MLKVGASRPLSSAVRPLKDVASNVRERKATECYRHSKVFRPENLQMGQERASIRGADKLYHTVYEAGHRYFP